MNRENPDSFLDSVLRDIREEEPEAAVMDAAAARVWARVQGQSPGVIRSCADYQALIPDYLAMRLSEGRALLLQDHTRECVACRKALEAQRSPQVVAMPAARVESPARPLYRWAVAAALLVGAGLGAIWVWQQMPSGGRPAAIASVDGTLFRLAENGFVPVSAGSEVLANTPIRTAKDSRAVVRLGDGTLVEMRERSEIAIAERRGETTIKVDRGSVIVQAAKQHGHLYVKTEDSVVSVTGTVFAVNRGMKGSRVSVIEGEVRVAHNNQNDTLRAGDQVVTNASLGRVPVEQEIAWSADLDKHLALLGEFSALGKKMEGIPGPGLRYSSSLLGRVPAGAVFVAAIPNLGFTLEEAHRLFRERLNESPVLREWWTKQGPGAKDEAEFERMVRIFADLGKHVGDEIMIYAVVGENRTPAPVMIAEARSETFRPWLETEIRAHSLPLRIIEDPSEVTTVEQKQVPILVRGNLVAASPEPAALRRLVSGGSFAGTPFHARIAEAYRNGAGWLFCVDMEQLLSGSVQEKERAGVDRLGFGATRYLIVEHREAAGVKENRAMLNFEGDRRGMASWLAAPAPIGGLDFVSPDASVVTAFIAKNPQAMLDDLMGFLQSQDDKAGSARSEFESAVGVDLRADLAGSLSGEVVIALDGSAVPLPEWVVAMEVYDAGRLQRTMEMLVAASNAKAGSRFPLRIEQSAVSGATYYALRGLPVEAHYVYTNGYLLAGSSRQVIARALQNKVNGLSIVRAERFAAALPRDGQANFSAMFYQNIAGRLAGVAETLSPQLRQSLGDLTKDAKPTLVLAYGERDRIVLASHGSFFGMDLQSVIGVPSGIQGLLQGVNGKRN